MSTMLRLRTVLVASGLLAATFAGCSDSTTATPEPDKGKMGGAMEPAKTDGAMDKGKMEGGAMETGKMGGAMDKGKMDGPMEKGKMDGDAPK